MNKRRGNCRQLQDLGKRLSVLLPREASASELSRGECWELGGNHAHPNARAFEFVISIRKQRQTVNRNLTDILMELENHFRLNISKSDSLSLNR